MRQPKSCGLGSIAMVVVVRVVWIGGAGQRTRGIDEGWRGEHLERRGEGLPYSVPARDFRVTNFWSLPPPKTFYC